MARKQIQACVQIADHEIRLVVGEFHENHLNILRVERVKHSGVRYQSIIHETSVVDALKKAVEDASNVLGYKIERVLLVVPSIQMKKMNGKVNVEVKTKKVQLSDIQTGINDIITSEHDENLELVNIGGIKYIINGISTRKLPLNEECDQFAIDLDLFYCEKNTLYAYANVIEKAGLEIMDICVDAYAIGEEAALFEKAVGNYIVLISLERQTTTLSLFSNGKLLNSEVLEEGYGKWASALIDKTGLKSEACIRLITDNAVLEEKEYSSDPVFLWYQDSEDKTLSLSQIRETVKENVSSWFEMMKNACEPIGGQVIVTGAGAEIAGMDQAVKMISDSANLYVPQTIGARVGALSAVLGMFYAYRDINMIRNRSLLVADEQVINESLKVNKSHGNEETGFTKKLKNIIMNEK